MAKRTKDPTEAICKHAATLAGVDEGSACTQASFKVDKKAFLYIGPQGGRFKAMFKLKDSMEAARKLAKSEPDRFEVGNTGWVTARFSAEEPMPAKLWKAWLKESYALAQPAAKKTTKKTTKKSTKKKTVKKAAKKAGSKASK